MLIRRGLGYLRREGPLNFLRRLLIFIILEWWGYLVLRIKLVGKSCPIVRDVQGSRMRLHFEDKGVSRELALMGVREKGMTETLQGELRQDICVLDIGANIGYYALMEARAAGASGTVYAVEPIPHNMQMLQDNIQLNGYTNIKTFQQAIGDHDGSLPMYISDHPNWCSFYPSGHITGRIEVPVSSVDSFLEGKRRPDIIRMDTEGYEYEIARGMRRLLASGAPLRLFIEFHPDIMGRERAVGFITSLREASFRLKKVIIEPNSYPPGSRPGWWLVDILNKKLLKAKFGAREMSIDDLLADESIMSGIAGDPALFLERDGGGGNTPPRSTDQP